jgi:hypothetical protein
MKNNKEEGITLSGKKLKNLYVNSIIWSFEYAFIT